MTPNFPSVTSEFLRHWQHDAALRWAPEDLAAQQEFVNRQIAGLRWLDWSTAETALRLWQGHFARTSLGLPDQYDALVLAGPIVEFLDPATLFGEAIRPLCSEGKLIGIVPCLRDNSPESQAFIRRAAAGLWSYYPAEELLELLKEAGWRVATEATGFVTIPRFNEAVLKGQLGFEGFQEIFRQLQAEGYDPKEVGWGELRFVAKFGA